MARKTKRGRKKTTNLVDLALNANVGAQFLEPYLTGGVVERVMAGDFQGALQVLRPATREALQVKNLIQAFGPKLGIAVLRKVLSAVGARRSARIGTFVIG